VSGTVNPAAVAELTGLLLDRLEPAVRRAAAQAAAHEHERTREWLESKGLPKAARVAQREAYNVLRQHGLGGGAASRTRAGANVGHEHRAPTDARRLSQDEMRELAETCVAMFEVHGQSIDVTLAELSAEAGGILLAEDAPKVRELAQALAHDGGKE
jgi:signal transduction histidine kinase